MALSLSRTSAVRQARALLSRRNDQSTRAPTKLSCPSIWIPSQTRSISMYKERTCRIMYWRARSFDAVKFPERKRSDFQDWSYRSEIFAFSRRLQENLSEDTLRTIFSHPSYVNKLVEDQKQFNVPTPEVESNSQLVQRGHKLLEDCVKPYLRHVFDRVPEDGICQITSYLASTPVLGDMAKWFGCKDLILCAEWPPSTAIMADTVKALLGGIESDFGLARTRRFVADMIISYLNDKDILDDVWVIPNPNQTLNLILSNSKLPHYEPRIMFQTGIKTIESCHIVGLYVNQKLIGSSAGETLEIAEECAALNALGRMFDLIEDRPPLIYGEASEKIDYDAHMNEHKYIRDWTVKLD